LLIDEHQLGIAVNSVDGVIESELSALNSSSDALVNLPATDHLFIDVSAKVTTLKP
jgi:hypothetical protein